MSSFECLYRMFAYADGMSSSKDEHEWRRGNEKEKKKSTKA